MATKIEVTRQDIDGGLCCGPQYCAVNRAVGRVVSPLTTLVDGEMVLFHSGPTFIGRVMLPKMVQDWIQRFDSCNGKHQRPQSRADLEPITFELDLSAMLPLPTPDTAHPIPAV